jgi:carboxymethylenebutenolidase
VIEEVLDVATRDGVMTARTFRPDSTSRFPLVVFYMDAFGLREALAGMARRLSGHGYVIALPDLFYRVAPVAPFDIATTFTNPPERDRVMELIRGLSHDGVMADTESLIDRIDGDGGVDATAVRTVGYCMGGGYALRAAGAFADRVVAGASYHGGHLATDAPDSPHRIASRAKGRLYVGYAEDDRSFPEQQRATLEAALASAGVRHSIERYHARDGFAVPDHVVYDEAAATRHWETLLALFREAR